MLDLTIAIPCKNEESNLPGCLSAIGHSFAKEIILIDSNSTDQTAEIGRRFGAQILDFSWNGQFPKKRNWFLRNHPPQTEWILFLDADEYITEAFKKEVREAISNTKKAGFWLNYNIYFLGKPLKGGYPLKKLALFRVGAGEYERIEEESWSHLDMEIHEHPILEGSVGEIRSRIDHRDLRGLDSWLRKHHEYALWEAKRYLQRGADTKEVKQWTLPQRIKYRLMGTPWIGPAFFFGSFFLLGGFRDGLRGVAWALLKCGYFTQVYCLIAEAKRKNQ